MTYVSVFKETRAVPTHFCYVPVSTDVMSFSALEISILFFYFFLIEDFNPLFSQSLN